MNTTTNAARIAAFFAATGCTPTTLNDLAIALVDATRIGADEAIDWANLPTFGGNEPSDTFGVWSWDANSLLVGEGSDLEIVPR
jgi:hypothetical protein